MTIINFCATPRTLGDLLEAGYTQNQVYNNVKAGKLVNLTRRDAWGRTRYNVPGLFQDANTWSGNPGQAQPASTRRFDAGALIGAWGRVA